MKKKRSAIGDSPGTRYYTINDIRYSVTGYGWGPERIIYRLYGETWTEVGSVFKENGGCWVTQDSQKCWRSLEQAVIEAAKTDQGVSYAR
jgi:hypothetical protein